MLGFVDCLQSGNLSGWHVSEQGNNSVDVFVDGKLIQTVECNHYREDLQDKAIVKDGLAGFSTKLDLELFAKVEVFCSFSGEELHGSPKINISSELVEYSRLSTALIFKDLPLKHMLTWPELGLSADNVLINAVLNNQHEVVGLKIARSSKDHLPEKAIEIEYVVLVKSIASMELCLVADQKILPNTDIKYPRILAHKQQGNHGLILYEYTVGKNLPVHQQYAFFITSTHLHNALLSLARIKNKTYSNTVQGSLYFWKKPVFCSFYSKLWQRCLGSAFKLRFTDAIFALSTILNLSKSSNTFAHGDLHANNILVNAKQEAIILDWDRYGFYPIGYDWAYLVGSSELNVDMFDAYEQLIGDYAESLPLNQKQKKMLIRSFWTLVYCRKWLHDSLFTRTKLATEIKKRLDV